jgi:opacity protein-like surface antigen
MATRIRQAGVTVALALLMAAALAGVAFAAQNVIQCPKITPQDGYCDGTNKDDVMEGTSNDDRMRAGLGVDIMYGRGGKDDLYGNEGPDVAYGGPGDDYLGSDCDTDYWCGEDEKHGGPGDDLIVGNLMSEKFFGGRGSDTLYDYKSSKRPDTFRCGPGYDRVYYNKGLDKVADDCEWLWAAKPINVGPH